MKERLAASLEPLADWLLALVLKVPLPVVRLIFLGVLAVLAVWVLSLPAQRAVDEKGRTKSVLTDLRLMAIGLLLLQSVFYLIF